MITRETGRDAAPGAVRLRYLALAGLLGAIVFAHWRALLGMVSLWNGTPMYSFGYIVPAVSAYLFWTRRRAVAAVRPTPALVPGLIVLAVDVGLLWGGHLSGILIAEQVALIFGLVGTVLMLFGVEFLQRTWVALAYLLLMIPFWDGLTEPLHQPFQLFSARLGVEILQFVGIPAYLEGVLVHLPNVTLEVARACSGVNYLVAVLALGFPLSYLYLQAHWRRVVLIAGAVLIAAVSNSLRVALIGLLSYWDVGSPLHGPLHVLHGLFVSGIGYVALFLGLRLLTPSGEGPVQDHVHLTSAPLVSVPWKTFGLRDAGALIGLFVFAGVMPYVYVVQPVPLRLPLASLPTELGAWKATGSPGSADTWWAGADGQLERRYASGSRSVDVWVGYFASQRQGQEVASYRSDVLHRAAAEVDLQLGAGRRAGVNLIRWRPRGRDQIGMFWYEIGGHIAADKYRAKWLTLWNSVIHRRNNGLAVVLMADRDPAVSEQTQTDELRELSALLHTALGKATEGR